jgi:hypothetical protein
LPEEPPVTPSSSIQTIQPMTLDEMFGFDGPLPNDNNHGRYIKKIKFYEKQTNKKIGFFMLYNSIKEKKLDF